MKTLKFCWLALIAIVMGASFMSCSKDNALVKGEDGIVVNEKRIVKIVSTFSENDIWTKTFEYDDKGRVIGCTEGTDQSGAYVATWTYTWGDDAIMAIRKVEYNDPNNSDYNYTKNVKYSLENNLIKYEDEIAYTYNSSNRLSGLNIYSYFWEDNKLVSIANNDYYEQVRTFSYNNTTCKKGYFPLIAEDHEILIAHPDLAGIRTSHLPVSERVTGKQFNGPGFGDSYIDEVSEYSYEFDKDGYITKITNVGDGTNTYIYDIIWK